MMLIDPVDIVKSVLTFKGFWKSSTKEKLQWIFILYPLMLFHVGLVLLDYGLYHLFSGLRKLLRRSRQ